MDTYRVIKSRYITEKSSMLEGLQFATSNKSLNRCKAPKYVFLVDLNATKVEIAKAVETIYSDGKNKITVKKVNTSIKKPQRKRIRGRYGKLSGFKKAVVTLAPGDAIEDNV